MVFELLKKVGKTALKMSKEAVAFVANRLQAAMFREALSMALIDAAKRESEKS